MAWPGDVEVEDSSQSQSKKEDEIKFEELSNLQVKRGYNIGLYGKEGTGKTQFALSATAPVYIIDTEGGASLLKENFPDKNIVGIGLFGKTEVDNFDIFQKTVDKIVELSKQDKVGTVIVDSVTDIWELCQDYCKTSIWKIKTTDRLKQQWDWGVINKLYMQQIKKLILANCNLIITARSKEDYAAAGQPTGTFSPRWMKETGFWVDYVLEMKCERVGGMNKFVSYLDKTRTKGSELKGKRFENLDFNKFIDVMRK